MTKHDNSKPVGCSKSSSKGKVYSNTILPQEIRSISNKSPILITKAARERGKNKTQNYQKKRNHKRAEINQTERKKTIKLSFCCLIFVV